MIRQLARTVTAQKPLRSPFSGCSRKVGWFHVLDPARRIERSQDQAYARGLICLYFAAVVIRKEEPQAFVPKTLDHCPSTSS